MFLDTITYRDLYARIGKLPVSVEMIAGEDRWRRQLGEITEADRMAVRRAMFAWTRKEGYLAEIRRGRV